MEHTSLCIATHPDAFIRYHASDLLLWVHSDASYLTESKAGSRFGGHHYLSNKTRKSNGPILALAKHIKHVMPPAAEAELVALFHNGKEAISSRTTLEELGHPQPPTPMQTENSTASRIFNKTVKHKRSKAIDMQFYWVLDRQAQEQFNVFWKQVTANLANYYSKHHPIKEHIEKQPIILNHP